MTDYCSENPWPASCLGTLNAAIFLGDRDRIRTWMSDHVDDHDDRSEDAFVVAVASLGSEMQRRTAAVARAALGQEVIFAPAAAPDTLQSERDVELIVSMTLNDDYPGIIGAMAGIRERNGVDEMIAKLLDWATVMLQIEAHLAGGR